MSDPAVNNRVAAKQALVDLISDARAGDEVPVEYGIPQADPQELIAVLQVKGEIDTPYMMGGRKARKDTFTVTIGCFAYRPGQGSAFEAETRCAQLVAHVDNAIAENPNLPPLEGVTSAIITSIEGPNASASTEGYIAQAWIEVTVTQRLI